MKRALVVTGMSVSMLFLSAGAASAHAVSVATPSGQSHVQVLHSGNTSLPPHTGAFPQHVACNVNATNPAVTILGPTACS